MSVTRQALEHIQRMIIEGELKPGDRLPPEHELADQLGVSCGSLREAVGALSHANILDVRRGDGTYVTSLEPDELMSGVVFALELVQARDMDEVLEVRRLLFPQAAALAAQRVTRGQLDDMHAIVEELENATSPTIIGDLHRRFGELIAEATGNAWLASILRALHIQSDHVRRAWLNSDPTFRAVALAHQRVFVEAFERGDAETARSIALLQIEARRRWIDGLRNRAEGGSDEVDEGSAPSIDVEPYSAYPASPMAKLTTPEVESATERVL
jgi:GntR family transcriptional regulator, transcriptional repressor for pyruvate dehydrogenase complex